MYKNIISWGERDTMIPSLSKLSISKCLDENNNEVNVEEMVEKSITVYKENKNNDFGRKRELAFDAAAVMIGFTAELLLKQRKWRAELDNDQIRRASMNEVYRILGNIESVNAYLTSVKWFNKNSAFLTTFEKGFLMRERPDLIPKPSTALCQACGKEKLEDPYCVEIAGCNTYSSDLNRDVLKSFVPGGWNSIQLVKTPGAYHDDFKKLTRYYNNFTRRSPRKSTFVIGSTCHKYCMHKWTARTTILEAIWGASAYYRDDSDDEEEENVCLEVVRYDDDWRDTLSERLNTIDMLMSAGDDRTKIKEIPTLEPQNDSGKWKDLEEVLG